MEDDRIIILPQPLRDSPLADIIVDLEKLRSKRLISDVPPMIFFQLKEIFQILETLGSARIEGNNTTLAEYVEQIIDQSAEKKSSQTEIQNLEKAIEYIEDNTNIKTQFTRTYVYELHSIVTQDLPPPPQGEGSKYPGKLRPHNVTIKKSTHIPPDYHVLQDYIDQFLSFINQDFPEKNQLLMVAIAHHRFAYIHPFDNGNGRMGRLLNYALLIKLGFQVKKGRLLNPSSVFYSDRNKYYDYLGLADSLSSSDVLSRVEYFLGGLKNEIEKIDTLLDKKYVKETILLPALNLSKESKHITDEDYRILKHIVEKDDMTIKAQELGKILSIASSVKKSRYMSRLREKGMVVPLTKKGRIYTIHFSNNYLLRSIIKTLENNGFVAHFLNS